MYDTTLEFIDGLYGSAWLQINLIFFFLIFSSFRLKFSQIFAVNKITDSRIIENEKKIKTQSRY